MYNFEDWESLSHEGVKRRSGRYKWGSGEDPYQHEPGFRGMVKDLRSKGLTDVEIAKSLNLSGTAELRRKLSAAKEEEEQYNYSYAARLKNKGWSTTAIAERMGRNESYVRQLLKRRDTEIAHTLEQTKDVLKNNVKQQKFIDVGSGVECYLDISGTKLNNAIKALEEEGYEYQKHQVTQLGTGKKTTIAVLAEPGMSYKEVHDNLDKIGTITTSYDADGYVSSKPIERPKSISSDRVEVAYTNPDGSGGAERDGVILLKRNVEDLSLGKAKYAQVRVAVDDTHYLKGMAMYGEDKDFPKGKDVIFYTNKTKEVPKMDVFKKMKSDPENPFGATIKMDNELILAQRHYRDKDGKEQLSALNIVNEEGNWNTWSKSMSSQFLSKQSPELAKRLLNENYSDKQAQYKEIMALENPTIKKQLLESFADDCDASAVHLKAAAMPRQASHVILPFSSIKDNEIYAPKYKDGERVVLVRYPFGGKFEMPELIVNNKNKEAIRALGTDPKDAVGINHKVASRLSGADFDGDSVLVIPNNKGDIKLLRPSEETKAIRDLRTFDPKTTYKLPDSAPKMSSKTKGIEMGKVSNLITDMTIKGASWDEIARAVRHSMVVIDAEKHHLDYKQSAKDNRIEELKAKYQGTPDNPKGGASSTIISRASGEIEIPKRKEGSYLINPETGDYYTTKRGDRPKRFYVDPNTGKKLYEQSGEVFNYFTIKENVPVTKTNKNGETTTKMVAKTIKNDKGSGPQKFYQDKEGKYYYRDLQGKTHYISDDKIASVTLKTEGVKESVSRMSVTEDAYSLTSGGSKAYPGTKIEQVYAEYANDLKALANKARLETLNVKPIEANPGAKKAYANEIASLKSKLNIALKNAPLERKAQALANAKFKAKLLENPELDADQRKKERGRALAIARVQVGAHKDRIKINDDEWEAIQNGAITPTMLERIIANSDMDELKQRAMPKTNKGINPAILARARAKVNNGYTIAEVAESLGISASTLSKVL